MKCDVCNKLFDKRYNFERHVKIHNKVSRQKSEFECDICGLLFRKKYNIEKHITSIHYGNSRRTKCVRIRCFLCKDGFKTRKVFGSHVERTHGLTLDMETILFPSQNDFQTWKMNLERINKCKYVLTRGVSSIGKQYYSCHRDGYFESKARSSNNRRIPVTNKMNGTCTSQLVVSEEVDGVVYVQYTSTHFGHSSDSDSFYTIQSENTEQSCDSDEIQAMLELLMSLNKQTSCDASTSLDIKQRLRECINIFNVNNNDFENQNRDMWENSISSQCANEDTTHANYSVPIKTEVVYNSDTLEVCNVYI